MNKKFTNYKDFIAKLVRDCVKKQTMAVCDRINKAVEQI